MNLKKTIKVLIKQRGNDADLEVLKLKGAALEIYKSDMTNKEIEDFTVIESLK